MPYRESVEPSSVVIQYGPLRWARVRLVLSAVLFIAAVGALRHLVSTAELVCTRARDGSGGQCTLRVSDFGTQTLSFSTSDIRKFDVEESTLRTTTRRGGRSVWGESRTSTDTTSVYTPWIALPDRVIVFDPVDKDVADDFLERLEGFLENPDKLALALRPKAQHSGHLFVLWLVFLALVPLVRSALRAGGGTLELTVNDKRVTVVRRIGPFRGSARTLDGRDVVAVMTYPPSARRAQLHLVHGNGLEDAVASRPYDLALDEHRRVVAELSQALDVPLGDPPAVHAPKRDRALATVAGLGGGALLAGALYPAALQVVDVPGVVSSSQPLLLAGCIVVGLATGLWLAFTRG